MKAILKKIKHLFFSLTSCSHKNWYALDFDLTVLHGNGEVVLECTRCGFRCVLPEHYIRWIQLMAWTQGEPLTDPVIISDKRLQEIT